MEEEAGGGGGGGEGDRGGGGVGGGVDENIEKMLHSFLNRNYVLKTSLRGEEVASCRGHHATAGGTSRGRGRAQEYNRSAVERQNHIIVSWQRNHQNAAHGTRNLDKGTCSMPSCDVRGCVFFCAYLR